jgi:hypothetical protein
MKWTRQRCHGAALDLQLHQTLRGKADHLAQQISIRALLQKRLKAHHLIGHHRVLGSVEGPDYFAAMTFKPNTVWAELCLVKRARIGAGSDKRELSNARIAA